MIAYRANRIRGSVDVGGGGVRETVGRTSYKKAFTTLKNCGDRLGRQERRYPPLVSNVRCG